MIVASLFCFILFVLLALPLLIKAMPSFNTTIIGHIAEQYLALYDFEYFINSSAPPSIGFFFFKIIMMTTISLLLAFLLRRLFIKAIKITKKVKIISLVSMLVSIIVAFCFGDSLLPNQHRFADKGNNIGHYLNMLEPGMAKDVAKKIIPLSVFTQRIYGSYMDFSPYNRYENHSNIFCSTIYTNQPNSYIEMLNYNQKGMYKITVFFDKNRQLCAVSYRAFPKSFEALEINQWVPKWDYFLIN